MGPTTKGRRGLAPDSPWADFLIGAFLLAACFACLCAYASHQRRSLHAEAAGSLPAAPMAQR